MKPFSPYYRSFAIGRLYYRFIKGTDLETQGLRSLDLARWLESKGFITLVTVQDRDSMGRLLGGQTRYAEVTGKALTRKYFVTELLPLLHTRA